MYRHILIPLDGSALAEQILPHVREIVTEATRVTLIRVVPLTPSGMAHYEGFYAGPTDVDAELHTTTDAAQDYLSDAADRLLAYGYTVNTRVVQGEPTQAIIDFVTRHEVDVVALATHGRSGLNRWLFGSVTERLLQELPVPALVIHPRHTAEHTIHP